jgi:hypothetical protein
MKRIEVGPMREPGAGVLVTTAGPRRVDWYQVKVGGGRTKRPIFPLESLASCPVLRIAPPNCVVITRGPGTAGLPSEQAAEDEEAKRFDLLILKLQLSVLRSEPAFARLRDQVKGIAALLEEQASIPMVHQQLVLIEEIQSDEWWQDVTSAMLAIVRKRLRSVVRLIEKHKRMVIYTDFEDEMGADTEINLLGFKLPDAFEQFRAKARAFFAQARRPCGDPQAPHEQATDRGGSR